MIRILETVEGSHAMPTALVRDRRNVPVPSMRPTSMRPDLRGELRRTVRGEVRFDAGTRAMYCHGRFELSASTDRISSFPKMRRTSNARSRPAAKFGAPVFSRGGGTSLAGETCNAAVVMDFSKYMNRIRRDRLGSKERARVQPGCVNDDLRNKAEERHLTFGPDPATHNRNTFGGMIGNNSCGMHAQMAGQDRGKRRGARDRHLRRPAHARRPNVGRRARAHHRRRRPQSARSTRSLRRCAIEYADQIRERSRRFRAASPAFRSRATAGKWV